MSSAPAAETLDSISAPPPPPPTPDHSPAAASDAAAAAAPLPEAVETSAAGEDDGEEEAECGFCLFMKGGGCKDAFVAWEDCVEGTHESGEDVVEKCFEVTAALKKCMDAHSNYYEPILRAEQRMSEEVEAEAADMAAEGSKSDEEVAELNEEVAELKV